MGKGGEVGGVRGDGRRNRKRRGRLEAEKEGREEAKVEGKEAEVGGGGRGG